MLCIELLNKTLKKQLSSVSTSLLSWLANTFSNKNSIQNDRNDLSNTPKYKVNMYSNLKIYQKFIRLKMITKKNNKQTTKYRKNMLRSNFKSLCGLNQTVRLDYVLFQYYFCKFVWFKFKLFLSKE